MHAKDTTGEPGSGDHGACATGLLRTLSTKATWPSLGDAADLPNT